MKFNPDIHHRRSIRLKNYNYSKEGAYFVTICAHNKECLFGGITDGKQVLNDVGIMIDKWWQKLSDKYDEIEIDEYCIMPNHIHGIINIVGANPCIRPNPCIYTDDKNNENRKGENVVSPLQIPMQNHDNIPNDYAGLGRYISWFKRMSTNEYIRSVKSDNWKPFNGKLWQRNYYEYIIRNETELNKISEYIINNPINWQDDENYV